MNVPSEYLKGYDPRESEWGQEAAALQEYWRLEKKSPDIRQNSKWLWGDQWHICRSPFTGGWDYLAVRALLQGLMVEAHPGGRKTSGILDPLAEFLSMRPTVKKIIFLTYKASKASFANCAIACARAGRRFRWLTNIPGKASFGFPVFQTLLSLGITPMAWAELLIAAFAFDYGPGHGADYFRDVKENLLTKLRAIGSFSPGRQTFRHAAEILTHYKPADNDYQMLRDAKPQLEKTLYALGEPNFLNCQGGIDSQAMIDIIRFFRSDTREFLFLEMEPSISRAVAFLVPQVILAVMSYAMASANDSRDIEVAFIVDEAADFACRLSAREIQRFRGKGGAFVFAYQHPGQFKVGGEDLRTAFDGFATTKIYLGAELMERVKELQFWVGERLAITGASARTEHEYDPTEDGNVLFPKYLPPEYYPLMHHEEELVRNVTAEARTLNVGIVPALSNNDLFRLLSQEGMGIIRSSLDRDLWRHAGVAIPAFFDFHISEEEHDRREALPWPVLPGTVPVAYEDVISRVYGAQNQTNTATKHGGHWEELKRRYDAGEQRRNS